MVTNTQRLKLNQNTIRKTVILLMTATLVVTSIGAATAKGKPSPKPVYYDVTMNLADDVDGLSTGDATCTSGDPLVNPLFMRFEESRNGSYLVADGTEFTSMPRLWLRANVDWIRTEEPHAGFDDGFDGCHGGPLSESDSDIPSYFVIHGDRSGNAVSILWAFDVYIEEGTRGKNKTPGVKEYFRLWSTDDVTFQDTSGDDCPLDSDVPITCSVNGPFEVWHYYPIEQIGITEFSFTLTMGPTESSG